ncbi:hypothetical protein FIU82_06115 [Pseudoalteromonas sp. THAF3]|uniref:hypothetical protein n=1 Tax=Pseudoalteromonas sp. THAF3 TaxID=2587843 RepID=UPI001267C8B7|nr:hypothetical protein [Pseudoalteromonas sp. THAF3]QFU04591.1 hypothetical protein FIU82_06115 [Pseudoalteromonas sp. THAF3]
MAKQYKIGLVIEGDHKGGVKAIKATDDALKKLDKQTKASSKESKGLAASIGGVATKAGVAGAAIAGAAAVAGSFAALLRTDVIKELHATASAFDVSVESLSSWSYAAESVGISTDKMGDIFKDTSDKIGDFIATGGGEAKDLFDNLNLSVDELKALKPDEQLLAIAEGLDEVGTNGEKIFYLESLADEASRLLPLLEDGAEGLKKLQREADVLGVTLDDVDAQMVKETADSFKTLGGAAEGFANQLTVQLSGAFDGMSDDIVNVIDDWGGMEKIVEQVIDGTLVGIGYVLDQIHKLRIVMKTVELGWAEIGAVAAEFLTGLEDGLAEILDAAMKPFVLAIQKIGEVVAEVADGFGDFLGETGEGLQELARDIRTNVGEMEQFNITGDDVSGVLGSMKSAAGLTRSELQELRNSSPGKDFVEDFRAAQKATREQAEETVALKEAADEAAKSTDNTSEALENQTEKLGEVNDATLEQTEASNAYADAWTKAVERIDEAFANGWLDIIEGNATDVFDSILDGFKQMLAEMAHQAITKPIVMNIQQAFTGGGSGGGGFDIGSIFSGGGGSGGGIGLNDVTSFFGGNSIGQGFANFGGYMGSQYGLYTNQYGGTLFGGAAGYSNMAYGAAGILGGVFGDTAGNNGGIGGSMGATIGMAAAGPIGAAVGAVIGAVAGSLIGAEWETYEAGVALSYDNERGLEAYNFNKEKKDRGLWRGNRYREEYDRNEQLSRELGAVMDGVLTNVESAADKLGITHVATVSQRHPNESANDLFGHTDDPQKHYEQWLKDTQVVNYKRLDRYLEDFSFDEEIQLGGLEQEEIVAKLNEFMVGQTETLVEAVFGDTLEEFHIEGELLSNTLTRVMKHLKVVEQGFGAINISLEELAATAGVSELKFADDVVQAAGGTDRLTALMQGYQSAFFTEQELLTRSLEGAASQVKGALQELGLVYGDDFRAAFEEASDQGLTADEMVQWLEAGNLVGQFEQLGERLASLTESSLEDVLKPIIGEAEATDPVTQKEKEDEQAAKISDPIVSGVSTLNETVNEQLSGSNERLDDVSGKLTTVNETLNRSMATLKQELKDVKAEADESIKATQAQLNRTLKTFENYQGQTSRQLRDVARLVAENPRDRVSPVVPERPYL